MIRERSYTADIQEFKDLPDDFEAELYSEELNALDEFVDVEAHRVIGVEVAEGGKDVLETLVKFASYLTENIVEIALVLDARKVVGVVFA